MVVIEEFRKSQKMHMVQGRFQQQQQKKDKYNVLLLQTYFSLGPIP